MLHVLQVAIQKIKPMRPAPAARQAPAAAAPAKPPPRKRARVAAGGTALLALFCFAVFSGPLWPLGGAPGSSMVPANLVRPERAKRIVCV
jgi:ferric-dicitrate binding protein FerR (iron transport regulator)